MTGRTSWVGSRSLPPARVHETARYLWRCYGPGQLCYAPDGVRCECQTDTEYPERIARGDS